VHRWTRFVVLLLVALGLLVACRKAVPPTPVPREVTRVVERTVVVTHVVTRVVTVAPNTADHLTLCLSHLPTSLDPLAASDEDAQAISLLTGRVLVGWETYEQPFTQVFQRVPTLANQDARLVGEEGPDGHVEITYRLRPDLFWEDGTRVRPEDFVAAWQAACEGQGTPRVQAMAQDVARVTVVDDHTFTVVLRDGLMTPLYMTYVFGPHPSHVPPSQARAPFSYGPYRLVGGEEGTVLEFEPNPHFHPQPTIPHLTVRALPSTRDPLIALLSGTCDVLAPSLLSVDMWPTLEEAREEGVVHTDYVVGPAWTHVDFNTWPAEERIPYFADVRVREAVLLALNREEMACTATHGLAQPMRSWLPDRLWAFEAVPALTAPAPDISRGRELLAEVGWRDEDGDGVLEAHGVQGTGWDGLPWQIPEGTRFQPTLVTVSDDPLLREVTHQLVRQLAALGIRVQVESLPSDRLWAEDSRIRHRAFDLALFSWLPGPDPDGRFLWVGNTICRQGNGHLYAADAGRECEPGDERVYPSQIPSAENGWRGGNISGWADADASLAIYQATAHLLPDVRAPYYLRHQTLFGQDVPVLPLFPRPRFTAWRASWQGLHLLPFEPVTWNVEQWHSD